MNACECLTLGAKLFPDRDALLFEGECASYAELDRRSNHAAKILQSEGVRRGDRVALALPNSISFVVWYYATLRVGAAAVSISPRLAAKEIAFILEDSEPRVAVVVGGAPEETVARERVESVLLAGSELPQETRLADALEGRGDESSDYVAVEPNEPAAILYTSGTTGFPKGAVLSHQNVMATVHAFNHLCDMRRQDRILIAVPLTHCYGQNALLNAGLNAGAELILQRRFELNETKRLIVDRQVTKLFGPPTMFQLICEVCEPADLRSVGYCFSAAATLPIQVSKRWQDKFSMPIYEGYGLTETSPFASYNHRLRHVPGSIGMPVDLVEMKIVDMETGAECPPGELGEIVIRGPNVMLGYWNRPDESANAIRDGWFHSGDIGRRDEQGYFYIVDRLKDIISVGGLKVFPAEVERVLLDHPKVREAAVIGAPDPVFGERVVAVVVGVDATVDSEELLGRCAAGLADYKVPGSLLFVDELPRNPSGKILKTVLRENYLSGNAQRNEAGDGRQKVDVAAAASRESTSDDDSSPLVERLLQVHVNSRESAVASLIADELVSLLGPDVAVPHDQQFTEAGLDSLMIVELR
ncbi:MAG: AMP-binding protein, partial [Planctomycetota bacterium]